MQSTRSKCYHMPRFYVPFWLSRILVHLFYFCPSLCPSSDRKRISKRGYGLDEKRHGNAVIDNFKFYKTTYQNIQKYKMNQLQST